MNREGAFAWGTPCCRRDIARERQSLSRALVIAT